jgi:hypothetical protein
MKTVFSGMYIKVSQRKTVGDAVEEFEYMMDKCDYANSIWTMACVLAGTDTEAIADFYDFCHERLDHPVTPGDVVKWLICWDTGTDWRV